jgi:hypothetical protein
MAADQLVLEEIRAMRASFDARFLAHEHASSQRFDRFEDRISDALNIGSLRIKEHSDRLRSIETESDTHPVIQAVPPQLMPVITEEKPRIPWWAVAALTGILTYLGPKVFTAFIDWLAHLNHIASTP